MSAKPKSKVKIKAVKKLPKAKKVPKKLVKKVKPAKVMVSTFPFEVPILYEDTDYLLVNKPAGLVVHSDGRTKEPTLVEWILEKYPKMKDVGEPMNMKDDKGVETPMPRPGIVHRLDRDTSGVLLIAKTQEAFDNLIPS